RLREHIDGLAAALAGLLSDPLQCTVDDALGRRLLAALHDDVHELGEHVVVELRIRQDRPNGSLSATGHNEYLKVSLFLGALGAVLGPALLALGNTGAIQGAANRVVADSGEILDAATTDEHHRVLLEVMAFATDVAGDLVAVGETDAANLAQRRVRL